MKDTSPSSTKSLSVSSDSSFYISFADELKRTDWLFIFLEQYDFYLGNRIMEEISKSLSSNPKFLRSVHYTDVDYYELVKPYFGRHPKHLDDGEYEAIGITHYLFLKDVLHYLIIDEKRIRNFVDRHFPYLMDKLVGSVGFIRDCCLNDKLIDESQAIDMLTAAKKIIDEGKMVFGVDKNTYEVIIAPILRRLDVSWKK